MLKKIFLLQAFIVTILLSGCAILHGDETASTAGLYDDDKARSAIISALHDKDPDQASGVAVLCFNSTVFLLGYADTSFQEYAASIARKTNGVSDVTTHWFPEPPQDRMQDATIAANIDSAIFLDKDLTSTRMGVEVFDGNVILCGSMRSQKNVDRAIEIARSIDNVKSVTSYLVY